MKEKLLLMKSFLIGGAALLATSCTNEEIIGGNPETETGNPGLSISIQTPAADGVVFTKVGTIEDEAAEWAVKTLNVYLFNKSGATEKDSDYKLYKHTPLNLSEMDKDGVTDNSDGTYSYNEPITADMIGKTMKVVLVANDAPAGVIPNTDGTSGTGLDEFKTKLANASVSEGSSADVLVGGTGDGATGFPMSYVGESDITMTPMGESVSATLTRTVARLDIFNYTPNLTVTGVSLVKAVNKSYLLPQAAFTDPTTGVSYVTINATQEWQGKFGSNGGAFVKPTKPDDQLEPWTPTEDDYKKVNTLKHVLYMYEQANAGENIAKIHIDYKLSMGGGAEKTASLDIPFTSSTEKIERNTLYTVKLGDGTIAQDKINATITVEDWVTEDVDVPLDPSEGSDTVE
ncbi:MAG: hypothetical protein SOR57_00550 [Parabacteroides sp.]|nr:hypothetical protein [Parabacteroides sp.]